MKSKNLMMNCGRGLNWNVQVFDSREAPTFRLQHCKECESELTLNQEDAEGYSYFTIEFATLEDWDDFVKAVLAADKLHTSAI